MALDHENRRYDAWAKAMKFFEREYEQKAAVMTASTCEELRADIEILYQQAWLNWEFSKEQIELFNRLIEIGSENWPTARWVKKSNLGRVRVVYDLDR